MKTSAQCTAESMSAMASFPESRLLGANAYPHSSTAARQQGLNIIPGQRTSKFQCSRMARSLRTPGHSIALTIEIDDAGVDIAHVRATLSRRLDFSGWLRVAKSFKENDDISIT